MRWPRKWTSLWLPVLVCFLGNCGTRVPSSLWDAKPTPTRRPDIWPAYAGVVLPPNIAPLNFIIREPGKAFAVRVRGAAGDPLIVADKRPTMAFPPRAWKSLLAANKGKNLFFDLCVMDSTGQWTRFPEFTSRVASESIDGYLVYRYLPSVYKRWRHMEILQRDLASFNVKSIITKRAFGLGCVNCHTFHNQGTNRFTLQIRGPHGGMIVFREGHTSKLRIKPPPAYMSWHPSGKVAAFSTNKVTQFYHSAGTETRDVIDVNSSLGLYWVEGDSVSNTPDISLIDRLESYPTWSGDGKYLYFSSAKRHWTHNRTHPQPDEWREVQYDLMRIPFDLERNRWGNLDTVLTSGETGKSIVQPRVSPDGRFLLFCMADYGCFPIFQTNSDLYLMDLRTMDYRRLDINSDQSESWHSWSSNSRWFVFSSKRPHGLLARPYFCHVDTNGVVSQPVMLPQKDPEFYRSRLLTFNVPELIREPVPITARRLVKRIRSLGISGGDLAITSATPRH